MNNISRNLRPVILLLVCTILLFGTTVFAQTPEEEVEQPAPAAAAGFQREGVFGCAGGEYAMSAGTISAVGGVYVPVNDAAVTINTGYLVHKECTLDGIVRRIAESFSAALSRSVVSSVNTGPDGKPQFVTNRKEYRLEIGDEAQLEMLKEYSLESVCSPYKRSIQVEEARHYWARTRTPTSAYACSFPGSGEDQARFAKGDIRSGGWEALWSAAMNPANYEFGASILYREEANARRAQAIEDAEAQVAEGNGFKPRYEIVSYPTATGENRLERRTLTPGTIIADSLKQVLGSGFRQTENATEIDQVIGSLFSGLSSHMVSDIRGLTGLTEARSGSASYLDRLSSESSAGVRQGATNAGISILNSALIVENDYNGIKRQILNDLNTATARLRAAEERCWQLITPAVQQLAAQGNCSPGEGGSTSGTCTPIPLTISTSTQYIRDGSLQLQAANPDILSAGQMTMQLSQVASFQSGSVTLNATSSASLTTGQIIRFRVMPSQPITTPTLSLNLTPESHFSSGTLSITLNQNLRLPSGRLTLSLIPVAPFTVAALALDIDVARQFADAIINTDIAPLVTVVEGQIRDSNNAINLLQQIANDLRNTNSASAQRIALERLDTLVANRLIHSAFDLRGAQEQRTNVQSTLNELVESTIEEWGSGNGWCNVQNPAVVQMWLSRWRTN